MSFAISEPQHIEDELRKIVRRQLRKTSRTLDGEGGSNLRTAVHQSRRSLKKVRAVAGCLKDAGAKLPRKDRKQLKSAARALSRIGEPGLAVLMRTVENPDRYARDAAIAALAMTPLSSAARLSIKKKIDTVMEAAAPPLTRPALPAEGGIA